MTLIRKFLSTLALTAFGCAAFGQQLVNVGAAPNDGTGDPARTAFQKLNADNVAAWSFLQPPITGDVSGGSGSNVLTIGAQAVTNAKLALMQPSTIKCNSLVLAAAPADCTVSQINAMIGNGGGSGGITSFTFTAPAPFTVTGASPFSTTGGTFSLNWATGLTGNQILATPCGTSGPVGLRSLCTADLPAITGQVAITAGVSTIQPGVVNLGMQAPANGSSIVCNPNASAASLQYCTPAQINTLIGAGAGSSGLSNLVNLCSQPGIDATGVTDSDAAVNANMQAVAGTNQGLYINCPIRLVIGYDPTKPIFVPSNLNLTFGPNGLFIVDNNTIPAFVFLHTKNITWTNPRIQYVGALALNNAIAPVAGVAGSFNDNQIKGQMSTYWGNTFSNGGSSQWPGPTNMSAIFKMLGAVQHATFINLKMFVADGTAATNFIPVAVSIDTEWLPSTLVNTNSGPVNASTSIGETDLNFINPVLDGFYMGFVGAGGSGNFIDPAFVRYSDLQDSGGGTQGGTGSWFAPPHAFYIEDGDPSFGAHSHVVNGYDWGVYVGGAIRRSTASGSLLSFKMSITNGTVVDGYTSLRPDGFMDAITNFGATQGGVLRNVTGIYNSQTVGSNGGYVWGWRFPTTLHAYQNLSAQNITMIDLATAPTGFPVLGPSLPINQDVSITGLKVFQQDLPSTWQPTINLGGTNINLEAEYHYAQMSTATQFLGSAINSGSFYCVSCNWDIKVFGWRQLPVIFNAALASGATIGSLATSWPYATGTYSVTFPDKETRTGVTFTNGSTTVGTWTALTAGNAAAGSLAGNALVNNLNGYKQRVLINYNGGSQNTRAHVLDVSNGYEITVENGVMTESWSQIYSGTPTGSSQATNIVYPSTFAIDRHSTIIPTALSNANGLTSLNEGWTGNNTALGSGIGISAGTNPVMPLGSPITLPNSPTTVVLYPGAGTFGTTGKVILSTRASQMSAAQ